MSVRFKVAGDRPFPMDMLRYDECFPSNSMAAESLQSGSGNREIELFSPNRMNPTPGRWSSFGWTVVEVEGVRAYPSI